MGLDMYLTAKQFVRYPDETRTEYQKKLETSLTPMYITYEMVNWRKANAVHKWFVDNVQDGVDDCKEYLVKREDLNNLLQAVSEVLEHPTSAPEILPTQEGFFFGATEYDSYYFEDLKYTKQKLEEILANPKLDMMNFEYHSSW